MAKFRGIMSKIGGGSIGDLTFKKTAAGTVVSEKITETYNPQTVAQMQVRTKLANIVAVYRALRPRLDMAFEKKSNSVSDYNEMVSLNANATAVYLTKQEAKVGTCIAAPYHVSQGTLETIEVSGTGSSAVTNIAVGSLSISSSTTVKELSAAIVTNNSGWEYGDKLSFIMLKQKKNETSGVYSCAVSSWGITLDRDNTEKVYTYTTSDHVGIAISSGKIAVGSSVTTGAFCWIHTRKSNSKIQVSSQALINNNTAVLALFQGKDALSAACTSYGAVKSAAFLSPDKVSSATDNSYGNQITDPVNGGGTGTGGTGTGSGGSGTGGSSSGGSGNLADGE